MPRKQDVLYLPLRALQSRAGWWPAGLILALALLLVPGPRGRAAETPRPPGEGCPVLLTFDVEQEDDVEALRALDPPGSCTFFITGNFATDHPELVRTWAARHEIACHTMTHPHLRTLDKAHQLAEIRDTAELLRKLSGAKCLGFRAPYLEYNADTREVLTKLGFRYHSSDWETSHQARSTAELLELPIAGEDAADYNLFEVSKRSDAEALKALIALYAERSRTGRPLVVLLHPYLIGKHAALFHQFVDYVNAHHGRWTSFRGWLHELEGRHPQRRALWVDVKAVDIEPQKVAEDALRAGFTDLLVQIYDPTEGPIFGKGQPHDAFVTGLVEEAHRRKLRVHAWLPLCFDPVRLRTHPEWAMVDNIGQRSDEWICPTTAAWRQEIQGSIRELLERTKIDGIQYDYIRFPNIEMCQCGACRAALARRGKTNWPLGLEIAERRAAMQVWEDYRSDLIRDLAASLNREARRIRPDLVLSAAVKPEGALSVDGVRFYGQSYEKLAPVLDFLAPMAYHQMDDEPIGWVTAVQVAGQWRAGTTPLWIGVQAWEEPKHDPLTLAGFGRLLDSTQSRSDGVALFSYVPLFNLGEEEDQEYNLPAEAVDLVRRWSQGAPVGPAARPSAGATSRPELGTLAHLVRHRGKWAPLGWGGGGASIGAFLAVLAFRPWQRGIAPAATDLPLPALEALALEPVLTGAQAVHVTQCLQKLRPAELDRIQGDALLLRIQEAGGGLPAEIDGLTERDRINVQASLRGGLIDQKEGCWVPTSAGWERLQVLAGDAALRAWTRFVHERLSEALRVTCPACRVDQAGHWLRPTLGCSRCHRRFPLRESPAIAPRAVHA